MSPKGEILWETIFPAKISRIFPNESGFFVSYENKVIGFNFAGKIIQKIELDSLDVGEIYRIKYDNFNKRFLVSYSINPTKIYPRGIYGTSLIVFNLEGKRLWSFPVTEEIFDLATRDGIILLGGHLFESAYALAADGQLIWEKIIGRGYGFTKVGLSPDGHYWVGFYNQLHVYNKNGNEIWKQKKIKTAFIYFDRDGSTIAGIFDKKSNALMVVAPGFKHQSRFPAGGVGLFGKNLPYILGTTDSHILIPGPANTIYRYRR